MVESNYQINHQLICSSSVSKEKVARKYDQRCQGYLQYKKAVPITGNITIQMKIKMIQMKTKMIQMKTKMTMKNYVIGGLLFFTPLLTIAAPSINDMQSCQGLLDFIDNKLESAPSKYPEGDVKKVRKGLEGYNQYIQQEIVSPGLLAFNGGDKAKASEMQKQVDAYKKTLVKSYQTRYKEDRIYTDQAVAVNNCAKKAVPSGNALDELKQALNIMVKLAQMD